MIQEYQIRVLPKVAYTEESIADYLVKEKGLDAGKLTHVRILRRSIDARQRTIYVNLKVRAYIDEKPQDDEFVHTDYPDVSDGAAVVVVGEGPGGLFAALRLIEKGLKPVVLERGKDVHTRKVDMALISRTQKVNPESNYSFGEGGAGAYSDGKLYTRSKKRGSVEKILNVFCQHGAPLSILADAHPHIGTDKLPRVIENMRNTILKSGGEVHFQTKMTGLLLEHDRVVGVEAVDLKTGNEETFKGPVILATGHSARDVYRYLHQAGIEIEAKGIALGVRLEHPAKLIDQIQYHNKEGRGKYLPAAEYTFVTQVEGRGVYSFCMCPGGFVIPAATGPEQIVVNGMSPSNRGTAWSNSGMVVEIEPEDIGREGLKLSSEGETGEPCEALKVMYLQEQLEKMCWIQGNRKQTAPAQRMADFVDHHLSYDLPRSSYSPGLISSPLHFWLPPFIGNRLQEGFKAFGKRAHGFLTNDAILIALETRTSAPVRIIRDRETLQHVRIAGLFPCGEGAGYAGGIVSAGMDGERCADSCADYTKALE
ncbi:NAD(P)/FAD-dependent oxidoreductase [Prevotella cerevisiae]|uniref:NAD(P)/FAD-dependent oxidoreductase n=1 Tax=Segatella cerevisiae TaxID=2053716 RepID=A0ABT1BT46_9BACT|nr:FAD-binding protein [Segatella cerevisiae]MCO6024256.1 NAD(P)/FAD-dependent oxidoreductase [Segatella cerevisiae]